MLHVGKPVYADIIHPDQTCGIPGRNIEENKRLINDFLYYITRKFWKGALISLDQKKAFDMVRHIFLIILLSVIGFGPKFRGWVALLYKNRRSQVLVNGHKTDPFDILRSVLQGNSITICYHSGAFHDQH